MYDTGEAFFFITTILIIKIKNIKHHNWHVPFCRTDTSTITHEEEQERTDKRVAAGNHEVIYDIAFGYVSEGVLRQDIEGLKWYHRALQAGSARAAFDLGGHYTCCDQPVRRHWNTS